MLVKFLSYAASLVSAGRHKPILISLAVVLFSITGITVAASFYGDSPRAGTSSAQPDTETDEQRSDTSPRLGLNAKDPKASADQPVSNQPPNSSSTNNTAPTTSSTPPTAPAASDITPSTSFVSINLASSTSTSITAAMTDNSNVGWSVTPNNSTVTAVTAIIDEGKDIGTNTVIRFRAEQNATPGEYKFTIHARDNSRGLAATKTITVKVEQ